MLNFLFIAAVTFGSTQVFADPYGMYEGIISLSPSAKVPNGRKVPISISLKQTDTEITPVNPTNVFYGEKKVEGSFVLDGESGPFGFSSSEYDLETGKLILQYGRLGSTGAPSSITNLRIQCTRLATGACDGTVSGIDALVGTISLKQTSTTATPLAVTPKYVGAWKGAITYSPQELARRQAGWPNDPNPATEEFDLNLTEGNGTVTNPDTYELASTPLKLGYDFEGGMGNIGQSVPYSTVYIDYLRGIARFTAIYTSSTFNGAEILTVSFQDDESIVGTMVTSYGIVGTVVAKKVQ